MLTDLVEFQMIQKYLAQKKEDLPPLFSIVLKPKLAPTAG